MAEKNVSIFNLSKTGRVYHAPGLDGKTITLKPNAATEVPLDALMGDPAKGVKVADFLLGKLAGGRARYPDLVDAAKMNPAAAEAKKELLDENAKLLAENAALKAQIAAADEGKKKDDGKKKEGGK